MGLSGHGGFGFYKYAAPTELKTNMLFVTFQKLFDLLMMRQQKHRLKKNDVNLANSKNRFFIADDFDSELPDSLWLGEQV